MVFTDKINIVMHHSSQGMYKKNILSKSLNIEVFKSSCSILLIFFLLVVGSRVVGYFEQAAEGYIDPSIIMNVVFLRFPDFITLLIPLSFFLGVMITVSRLYAEREIYGYLSGGISQIDLIKFLIPQSIIFFFITLILSIYVAPYTKELSREIISIDTIDEQIESIKPKNIFSLKEVDGFMYIDSKNQDSIGGVALFISNSNSSSLILADRLNINKSQPSINLNFQDGSVYRDIWGSDSSIISKFDQLKLPIEEDKDSTLELSFSKLFDFSSQSSVSQMQWNISIPLTIFILLVIGVHLSKVEPRQGRLSVMLPAIFIYILYLSLQYHRIFLHNHY